MSEFRDLTAVVRRIGNSLEVDVCSLYLLEDDELVLAATVGLKWQCVGRLRMRLDEGLTGLVAEQRSPLQVQNASAHPRFKYFPEAGEEAFSTFLAVPVEEGDNLVGVLVVQTVTPRRFRDDEVAALCRAAHDLSDVLVRSRAA